MTARTKTREPNPITVPAEGIVCPPSTAAQPSPSVGARAYLITNRARRSARFDQGLQRRLVSLDRAERPTVVTSVRKARPKYASMRAFDGRILLARPLNLTTRFDS